MALLSFYSSNWPPFQQLEYYSSSESSVIDQFIITQQTELSPDFNQPPDEYLFYSSSDNYPTNYNISSRIGDDLMTSNDNMIDIEPFNYPKLLQKNSDYVQNYYHDNQYFIDDGLVQNPNCLTDLLPPPSETFFISPGTILPADDFSTGPPSYRYGTSCVSLPKKETTAAECLSAQSIAARQRRRKIAERTHELGKLVPGGRKMNTAEMLQAAYKYIKFLQAQVGILQFLDSYHQENKNGGSSSESDEELDLMQLLHVLLESPVIHEKLYSTGKCLIPMKFAQEIIS